MRHFLTGLVGLALMTGLTIPVMAQHTQPGRAQPSGRNQQSMPAKQQPQAQQARPNRQAEPHQNGQGSSRYGRWDQSWGARPSTPPKHWTRTSDWHRHVRACQQRFRSYDSRTDTYRTNNGQRRRCAL